MAKRLPSIWLVLIAVLILVAIRPVFSTTGDFPIPGGEEKTIPISLQVDDHVLIKFSVAYGNGDNFVDFYVNCPNGTRIMYNPNSAGASYSFVCDSGGNYIIHISNKGSTAEVWVALDYEIDHYILGMPQMLFLAILIALICVVAVAVFVLTGRSR
jgi:hypothetical protein